MAASSFADLHLRSALLDGRTILTAFNSPEPYYDRGLPGIVDTIEIHLTPAPEDAPDGAPLPSLRAKHQPAPQNGGQQEVNGSGSGSSSGSVEVNDNEDGQASSSTLVREPRTRRNGIPHTTQNKQARELRTRRNNGAPHTTPNKQARELRTRRNGIPHSVQNTIQQPHIERITHKAPFGRVQVLWSDGTSKIMSKKNQRLSAAVLKEWAKFDGEYWDIEGIVNENWIEGKFEVQWSGTDDSGKPYPNNWVDKKDVTNAALLEWRRAHPSRRIARITAPVQKTATKVSKSRRRRRVW